MGPVALGHVGRVGDIAAGSVLPEVGGDPLAAIEHLDGRGGHTHVETAAHQLVGHGVEPVVHRQVVVDADGRLLPLGHLVAGGGQRAEGVSLLVIEQVLPRGGLAPEGTGVHHLHLGGDGLVQVTEGEEPPVAQRGQHPALDGQHAGLHSRLVPGPIGAGGQDGRLVVGGELGVGGVELGLVEAVTIPPLAGHLE